MNASSTTWRQYFLLLLLFAFIAVLALSPLYSNTFFPYLADFWNHVAMITHAKLALLEGQFPLRVAPIELNHWRYPQFQFYSPTSYTFAGIIYACLPTNNPFIAYKITILIALILGGLYFYRLSFWFVQFKPAALLATVIYLTSPYYLIVINLMGSFNEAIALGLLPAVLFYTLQCYYDAKTKTLLQVSLVWYVLATVHFITFFYSSILIFLLLLVATIRNHRHQWNLIYVGLSYGFGCILAMWYLGPILTLGKYFNITRTMSITEFFTPSLADLFSVSINLSPGIKDKLLGYRYAASQIHPNIGLPILFAIVFAFYLIITPHLTKRFSRSTYLSPFLLGLFFVAFIMVWSPFNFWEKLPTFLSMFQYSWRLLSQVTWIGALLFAWSILFFKQAFTPRITFLLLIILVISTASWLPVIKRPALDAQSFLKNPKLISRVDSYVLDPKKYTHFRNFSSSMLSVKEKNCHQQEINTICKIRTPTHIQSLVLPILYYPNMQKVILNGKEVPYQSVLYQKYLFISITPQIEKTNEVIVQFTGLPWANNTSRIGWCVWGVIFVLVSVRFLL